MFDPAIRVVGSVFIVLVHMAVSMTCLVLSDSWLSLLLTAAYVVAGAAVMIAGPSVYGKLRENDRLRERVKLLRQVLEHVEKERDDDRALKRQIEGELEDECREMRKECMEIRRDLIIAEKEVGIWEEGVSRGLDEGTIREQVGQLYRKRKTEEEATEPAVGGSA